MSKNFHDFIESRQDSYYGFEGLHDTGVCVPPTNIYKLLKIDFSYDESENVLVLNIGNYLDKKIEHLLESLFIPMDELHFDLGTYIKQNKIRLVLVNNIRSLNQEFLCVIRDIFVNLEIRPIYEGEWNEFTRLQGEEK